MIKIFKLAILTFKEAATIETNFKYLKNQIDCLNASSNIVHDKLATNKTGQDMLVNMINELSEIVNAMLDKLIKQDSKRSKKKHKK